MALIPTVECPEHPVLEETMEVGRAGNWLLGSSFPFQTAFDWCSCRNCGPCLFCLPLYPWSLIRAWPKKHTHVME